MIIAKKSYLITNIWILGLSKSLKDNEKFGQNKKIYITLGQLYNLTNHLM